MPGSFEGYGDDVLKGIDVSFLKSLSKMNLTELSSLKSLNLTQISGSNPEESKKAFEDLLRKMEVAGASQQTLDALMKRQKERGDAGNIVGALLQQMNRSSELLQQMNLPSELLRGKDEMKEYALRTLLQGKDKTMSEEEIKALWNRMGSFEVANGSIDNWLQKENLTEESLKAMRSLLQQWRSMETSGKDLEAMNRTETAIDAAKALLQSETIGDAAAAGLKEANAVELANDDAAALQQAEDAAEVAKEVSSLLPPNADASVSARDAAIALLLASIAKDAALERVDPTAVPEGAAAIIDRVGEDVASMLPGEDETDSSTADEGGAGRYYDYNYGTRRDGRCRGSD